MSSDMFLPRGVYIERERDGVSPFTQSPTCVRPREEKRAWQVGSVLKGRKESTASSTGEVKCTLTTKGLFTFDFLNVNGLK